MSQLCFYLPPFSSDYAGACAAFFDLDGMVIINDGMCCTRNYISFDEPRWFGNKKPIYCSGLRETEAVLGADQKLVRDIRQTLETIEQPEFIALLGSPVPMMVGTDFTGLAREVEAATGIPAIGLDTTGFQYYDKGFAKAVRALISRFTCEGAAVRAHTANVLGTSPMDFSDGENATDIDRWLEERGWRVNSRLMMHSSIDQLQRLGEAQVNLVVSAAGLDAARLLRRRFGTPYVAGFPVGGEARWLETRLAAVREGTAPGGETLAGDTSPGNQRESGDAGAQHQRRAGAVSSMEFSPGEQGGTLVVADQVVANSVREYLGESAGERAVSVATFFTLYPELACAHDVALHSEDEFVQLVARGGYARIIGDPLLAEVPGVTDAQFIPLTHMAISSNLYWHQYSRFTAFQLPQRT